MQPGGGGRGRRRTKKRKVRASTYLATYTEMCIRGIIENPSKQYCAFSTLLMTVNNIFDEPACWIPQTGDLSRAVLLCFACKPWNKKGSRRTENLIGQKPLACPSPVSSLLSLSLPRQLFTWLVLGGTTREAFLAPEPSVPIPVDHWRR